MPRANMALSTVGMIAPMARVRRDDSARAAAWGVEPNAGVAASMRMRSSELTDSGLFGVREIEAVETPTCLATSRIPTDFGFMMKQFTANGTSPSSAGIQGNHLYQ